MVIVLKKDVTQQQFQEILNMIKELGYQAHVIQGTERTVIGAVGSGRGKDKLQAMENLPGVENVVPILQPYKLASLEIKPEKTVVSIRGEINIGGNAIVVMAGPCSVESREQIIQTAQAVKAAAGPACTSEIVFVQPKSERISDDPQRRQPDITRARTVLGWEPRVSLEEGLRKTIEYFRHKM